MARKKIFNINQRYLLIFSGPVHPDISAHSAVCTDFITVIFNQIVYDVYTVLGGGENGGEGGGDGSCGSGNDVSLYTVTRGPRTIPCNNDYRPSGRDKRAEF